MDAIKSVIIIPTYNEHDNIGSLIERLQEQFPRMSQDMHILVVDDNSPDGTADIVREKQRIYANLHLLSGKKEGLGAAYIRGMRFATRELGADIVYEMDADFSHKPEDVPRLMSALQEGADFAIGSRYVEGGSIPPQWGWLRRMNSHFGNLVARRLGGLRGVHDCTAGFRAIKTDLLGTIPLDALRVRGYAFQVALLHQALARGATINEIPVDFIDRSKGKSKLGFSDIVEFILNVCWIRFQRVKTFMKFCTVGASGVFVNLAAFTLLLYAGVNKYIASPVAIEVSIITNFLFNNYWTFRWNTSEDRMRIRGLKYNVVSFLAMGVSYSTFVLLSTLFPKSLPQLLQLLGVVPGMLVNYFLNARWTFKHYGKLDTVAQDQNPVARPHPGIGSSLHKLGKIL